MVGVNLTVVPSSTQDVTEQDELIVMYRFYYHMEIERYSIVQISSLYSWFCSFVLIPIFYFYFIYFFIRFYLG